MSGAIGLILCGIGVPLLVKNHAASLSINGGPQ
jgi:hypothetical protein